MYICVCKAITDKQIRKAVIEEGKDFKLLKKELGLATQCGKCVQAAVETIQLEMANSIPLKQVA